MREVGAEEVILVYNETKPGLSFLTRARHLMTVNEFTLNKKELEERLSIEPPFDSIVHPLSAFLTSSMIYRCLLENLAAEQAGRITSMDGASRCAEDMLKSLKDKANKERQARITTALIEVVSAQVADEL
eukprot:Trichotokara_eunicae@DN2974_c0_g1_i1.p1